MAAAHRRLHALTPPAPRRRRCRAQTVFQLSPGLTATGAAAELPGHWSRVGGGGGEAAEVIAREAAAGGGEGGTQQEWGHITLPFKNFRRTVKVTSRPTAATPCGCSLAAAVS